MKTNELIYYEKKLPVLSAFTGFFGGSMKKAMCNYFMLCNSLVLYKKILSVRQLLFKGKMIQGDLANGSESLKCVLAQ